MPETFAAILTAHLLGDFIVPADLIMGRKNGNIGFLLFHAFLITTASFLLLGQFHWPTLLILLLTHFSMDALRLFLLKDTLKSFLIEQWVYLTVFIGSACTFPGIASTGWWRTTLDGELWNWYFVSLSFASGLITIVPAGGILIAKVMKRFVAEIGTDDIPGLKNGGQYIGWLERSLVLLLLLMNQPTGIGFLIAAKSILRFGEIKDASQRRVAEYIIIGTFLSFGWALLFSVMTQSAIQHWMPTHRSELPPVRVIIEQPPPGHPKADDGTTANDTNIFLKQFCQYLGSKRAFVARLTDQGLPNDTTDILDHCPFQAGQVCPPPSTRNTWPLTKSPSGPAKNSTTRATSSTAAMRSRVPSLTRRDSSTCRVPRNRPVRVSPGASELTVTLYGRICSARQRVYSTTAALAVA
jgi:Protein of unknown function (DUF3307)